MLSLLNLPALVELLGLLHEEKGDKLGPWRHCYFWTQPSPSNSKLRRAGFRATGLSSVVTAAGAAEFGAWAIVDEAALPVSTSAAHRCGGFSMVALKPLFNLECSKNFFEFSKNI